jgi:hypothetical protein
MKLASFLFFFCLYFSPAIAETLTRLEEITARYATMVDMLNDPEGLKEYREALKAYMGENATFDPVLDEFFVQIKDLSKNIPGFAEKAWKTNPDWKKQSYVIKGEFRSSDANHATARYGRQSYTYMRTRIVRQYERPYHEYIVNDGEAVITRGAYLASALSYESIDWVKDIAAVSEWLKNISPSDTAQINALKTVLSVWLKKHREYIRDKNYGILPEGYSSLVSLVNQWHRFIETHRKELPGYLKEDINYSRGLAEMVGVNNKLTPDVVRHFLTMPVDGDVFGPLVESKMIPALAEDPTLIDDLIEHVVLARNNSVVLGRIAEWLRYNRKNRVDPEKVKIILKLSKSNIGMFRGALALMDYYLVRGEKSEYPRYRDNWEHMVSEQKVDMENTNLELLAKEWKDLAQGKKPTIIGNIKNNCVAMYKALGSLKQTWKENREYKKRMR